jgi:hypothetical protein
LPRDCVYNPCKDSRTRKNGVVGDTTMRVANKNIDWPQPCDLTADEHHEQTKKLLEAARHCFNDNPRIYTLTQLAARQGVSVEELRDDARKWDDTDVRFRRLAAKLDARLEKLVLGENGRLSRAAVQIIRIERRERQLSSANRVVPEGGGYSVHVINFAELGMKRDMRDEDGSDSE